MTDKKEYGVPLTGTSFRAYTPADRAEWLYDTIRKYEKDVERILDTEKLGYREGWSIVKNEMYEVAFLRAFEYLMRDNKNKEEQLQTAERMILELDDERTTR